MMNKAKNQEFIFDYWEDEIQPSLMEYVRIPNKSPLFDPNWKENGYMDDAVVHLTRWIEQQNVSGLVTEVHRLQGRTPVILSELPGEIDTTILIYGHLDKQPEFLGWDDGLSPWTPVRKHERLYGRGAADDGYAIYTAIAAIKSMQNQRCESPRLLILIEASEESGSPDLPFYMDDLAEKIGTPGLVIALDSTCGNYDQLWITTSLRGMLIGDLTVQTLEQGVHSGAAGGIVASSFRVLRQLISRLEDEKTGVVTPSFLNNQVPEIRRAEAIKAGQILKDSFADMYPFAGKGKPMSEDPTELVLNNTWAASLEVTGLAGAPDPQDAGNVLRPETTARLALRISPTTEAQSASERLQKLMTENPPHNSEIRFQQHSPNPGWHAPVTIPALVASVNSASNEYFGADAVFMGCGGSIPFMEFLASRLPRAQFIVTGVLGPHSNAHGPNEFLDIPTAKKLTACVTQIIDDWGALHGS